LSYDPKTIKPLPDDQPVRGRDVQNVADGFQQTRLDTAYMLGIHPHILSRMTSTDLSETDLKEGHTEPGTDRTVDDPSKALFLRVLTRYPERCPTIHAASPHEVLEAITQTPGYQQYRSRHFGMLLGCELSSAYRWNAGSGVTPAVGRYLTLIKTILDDLSGNERRAFVDELIGLAEAEAQTRGLTPEELWNKGSWVRDRASNK
jgi:hypothetical protein